MHWLKNVAGAFLGSVAVGMQVVNVLICIFIILLGPAYIVKLMYV
jgi:hypothetical protein